MSNQRILTTANKKWHWLILILLAILCCCISIVACDNDDDDGAKADNNDETADDDVTNDDDAMDDDDDDNDDDDDDDNNDDNDSSEDVWTDSISGLVWQNGNSDRLNWEEAISYCETLSWADYNDWRLPTLGELRSLIRGCDNTATGGACGVTDDCLAYMSCWDPPCQGCSFLGGPGPDGRFWPAELAGSGWVFWSSCQVDENHFTAWRIHFYNGLVSYNDKDYLYWARCVRQAYH